MNIKILDEPFPHIFVYDYFTDKELDRVWKELDFLSFEDKLLDPVLTGAGKDIDGNFKKRNKGLFLDDIYLNRDISDILTLSIKIFSDEETRKTIKDHSWFFSGWYKNIKKYNTLLTYYEDGDYYLPHGDNGYFTHLIHLFRQPKSFEGGELNFPDFKYKIENISNRLLIFPSYIQHEVLPMKMVMKERFKGLGRYTITNFCSTK